MLVSSTTARADASGARTEDAILCANTAKLALTFLIALSGSFAPAEAGDAIYVTAGITIEAAETANPVPHVIAYGSAADASINRMAMDSAAGRLYWTEFSANYLVTGIYRVDLTGDHYEPILEVSAVGGVCDAIALDASARRLYWAQSWGDSKIQRADLDGSHVETLVSHVGPLIHGMDLDLSASEMYWTVFDIQPHTGKIVRASLEGQHVQDFITGLEQPDDVALDVAGGKIYWVDGTAGKLQRANLADGSDITTLISTGRPCGIALDPSSETLYWVDRQVPGIRKANFDGSNAHDILREPVPWSIELGPGAVAVEQQSWGRMKRLYR